MADLKQRLETKHPEYKKMEQFFKKWDDQSTGKNGYLDGQKVIPHPREDDDTILFRRKFAKYEAFSKQIADDWIPRLYGPDLILSLDSPDLKNEGAKLSEEQKEFVELCERDFDLLGTAMLDFFVRATYQSAFMGTAGVLVNVFDEGGADAFTALQEEESGRRPYARSFTPSQIRNWSWDHLGRLEWVLLREATYVPRLIESEFEPYIPFDFELDRGQAYRYYFVTPNNITVYNPTSVDNWVPQVIEHNLGTLPFERLYWEKPDPFCMFARPVLEEVYEFQDLIYQLRSGVTEVVTNQCFSLFIVAGRGGRKEGDKEGTIEIGSTRGLRVPDGAGFPPFFASPEAELPRVHLDLIKALERAINRIAKQGANSLVDDGKSREASGRSKVFDIDKLTAFLRRSGDNLENAIQKVLTTFLEASILGSKKYPGVVKFPNDFHLRSVLEEADEALALCSAIPESETVCRVAKRKLALSALRSDISTDERESILEEIRKNPIVVTPEGVNSNLSDSQKSPVSKVDSTANRRSGPVPGERRSQEQPGPSPR